MDVHFDGVAFDLVPPRIQSLLELLPRQHAAGVQHEFLQQVELLCLKVHRTSIEHDLACRSIEMKRADGEDRRRLAAGASDQRAQSRGQLVEIDGLDDIIVSAGVESLDAVIDGIAGGQNQHRRAQSLSAHLAQHCETIDFRQPQIEHDGGKRVAAQRQLCRGAVHDPIDIEPALAQPRLQRIPQKRIVFDDENAHRDRSSRRDRRGAGGP